MPSVTTNQAPDPRNTYEYSRYAERLERKEAEFSQLHAPAFKALNQLIAADVAEQMFKAPERSEEIIADGMRRTNEASVAFMAARSAYVN